MATLVEHKQIFKRQREFLICLALALAVVVVYWRVQTFEFVNFDDTIYVTNNYHVRSGLNIKSIGWAFNFKAKQGTYWQPLTWLSHMLDCQLFGLNPGRHHLTSLILHLVNTLLVFLLLKRMTGAFWQSAAAAALFGLHPVNVESVAWVAARKNVLSTFFWICCLAAYTKYARRPNVSGYLLVMLILTLGLMSKPMLITLPLVFLLLDYWPLGRLHSVSHLVDDGGQSPDIKILGYRLSQPFALFLEKVPLLVLCLVSVHVTLSSLKSYGNVVPVNLSPLKLRFANALVSYAIYIWKMLWPTKLALLYPFPEFIPPWQIIGAGLLLAAISTFVLRAAAQRPYLAIGWLWFIGTLVPAIGLVQGGMWPAQADRFAYVPFIGLFILVAWGLPGFLLKKRHGNVVLALTAGILIPLLMVCSWYQNSRWQNSVKLFAHNLNVTPGNTIAHFQLGLALEQNGKIDAAMTHYSKVIQIDPNYAPAYTNLGALLALKGDFKAAVHNYYQALRLNPEDYGTYNNLGIILNRQGKTKAAISYYREALRLRPDMKESLYNLAWLLATHSDDAFRDARAAVSMAERLCRITDYKEASALDALAAAYAAADRYPEAVATLAQGIETAEKSGLSARLQAMKSRLRLYRSGKPYRQE